MDRRQVKTALESTKTLAVVLNSIMGGHYGEEWLEWDLLTIYYELRESFDCEPSSETMDRLGALQVLQLTSEFFDRLDAFLGIANSLNSGNPSFSIFNPVGAAEAAWAVTEVSLIRDLLPFAYPVRKYIDTVSRSEGMLMDEQTMAVLRHIVTAADPSSNVVKDIYTEAPGLMQNIRAGEDYVDDQLRDVAAQFHNLGMAGELVRIMNVKDLEDALSA